MSLKKNKTEEKGNPPDLKFHVGLVNVAIWEKATENGTFYDTKFQRRFKDKDGNWKSSQNYNLDGLLALKAAVDIAITKIVTAMEEDRATRGTADPVPTAETDDEIPF